MITLSSQDQLRQRMAWLSQILIVTPKQINEIGLSEAYLNYYDNFVRSCLRKLPRYLKRSIAESYDGRDVVVLRVKELRYGLYYAFFMLPRTKVPIIKMIRSIVEYYHVPAYILRSSAESWRDRTRISHAKSCNSSRSVYIF